MLVHGSTALKPFLPTTLALDSVNFSRNRRWTVSSSTFPYWSTPDTGSPMQRPTHVGGYYFPWSSLIFHFTFSSFLWVSCRSVFLCTMSSSQVYREVRLLGLLGYFVFSFIQNTGDGVRPNRKKNPFCSYGQRWKFFVSISKFFYSLVIDTRGRVWSIRFEPIS